MKEDKTRRFQTKKRCHIILIVLSFLILLALLLTMLLQVRLPRPRDNIVQVVPSADGKHLLCVYESSGSATVAESVTVSVQDPASKKEWNIYFHYRKKHLQEATWIDNETVRIDGTTLNIYRDYYESFQYI